MPHSDVQIPLLYQKSLLGKNPLPHFQPLPLQRTQTLPRILKTPRHDFPQSLSHSLNNQHRLPVAHSKACTVSIQRYDAGVKVAAYVATEEGDSEVGDRGGFVGVVKSIVLLVMLTTDEAEEGKE